MRQMMNFIEFRFLRDAESSLFLTGLMFWRKTSSFPDASQQYFCCGYAALSALEVCTLMGLIDLNNIRGCGDVIKAEITSL